MKKFVDDIGVLAIEQCLISKLPTLFNSEMVYDLTQDEISHLAAETEETTAERAQCAEKLAILEAGLRDLKRLDKLRPITSGKSRSFFIKLMSMCWLLQTLIPSPIDMQLDNDETSEGAEDQEVVSLRESRSSTPTDNDDQVENLQAIDKELVEEKNEKRERPVRSTTPTVETVADIWSTFSNNMLPCSKKKK